MKLYVVFACKFHRAIASCGVTASAAAVNPVVSPPPAAHIYSRLTSSAQTLGAAASPGPEPMEFKACLSKKTKKRGAVQGPKLGGFLRPSLEICADYVLGSGHGGFDGTCKVGQYFCCELLRAFFGGDINCKPPSFLCKIFMRNQS